MNIHEKLAEINMALFGIQIPKSGFNKHKGYRYHELEDMIPPVTKECYSRRLGLEYPYADDVAILKIVNLDDPKEYLVYRLTFPELVVEEKNPNNKMIQAYGADITYLQKYLLKLAFPALSDKDIIDSADETPNKSSSAKHEKEEGVVEEVTTTLDLEALYTNALKKLESKGLSGDEITHSAIRKQIFKDNKFTVKSERNEIAKYCKETWGASK